MTTVKVGNIYRITFKEVTDESVLDKRVGNSISEGIYIGIKKQRMILQ